MADHGGSGIARWAWVVESPDGRTWVYRDGSWHEREASPAHEKRSAVTHHAEEADVLARVRVLAASEGMISRCDQHGYGPDARIHSSCDWCAAYGVDQDWREALSAILDPGPPRGVAASSADHNSAEDARLLSRLLFQAREQVDMWADSVERRTGRPATEPRCLVAEIDQYRAQRGWPAEGFGGEPGTLPGPVWVGIERSIAELADYGPDGCL